MYTITKEFEFSASHQLLYLAEGHPCSRLHGHNYRIRIECKNAVLNKAGFVLDYHELEGIKTWLNEMIDHEHLNNLMEENPTAENIATMIYRYVKHTLKIWQISAVEVSETPKTNCRYEPDYNTKL